MGGNRDMGGMEIWEEMRIWGEWRCGGNGNMGGMGMRGEWRCGREWGCGEWAKAGIDKGADNKIKRTPHSRESGNLPIPAPSAQITKRCGAGVARPAPVNREIPAFAGMGIWGGNGDMGGMGIWGGMGNSLRGAGMGSLFNCLLSAPYFHSPRSPIPRECGNLPSSRY